MRRLASTHCLRLVCLVALFLSISTLAFSQIETIFHHFGSVPNDGLSPLAGVVRDAKGNLYGTTSDGGTHLCSVRNHCGTIFEITSKGQYKTLYDFSGGAHDGWYPEGELALDAAGNLYGSTVNGGSGNCPRGCGTIFKLTPSGNIAYLRFLKPTDGSGVFGKLLMDATGNLYGNAAGGGTNGRGTIFEITSSGQFIVLHSFNGSTEGGNPQGGLVMGTNGSLYGVAVQGGQNGVGTVYKLTPTGKLVVLHSFKYDASGAYPNGPVYVDSTGNIYGTTGYGGSFAGNCGTYFGGCGVVYSISAGKYKVLHIFTDGTDGAEPVVGLKSDGKGNLYGTTLHGGDLSCMTAVGQPGTGCGVVFQMSTAGNETVRYAFQGYPADGSNPWGTLTRDAAGHLYGTTAFGGTPTAIFGTVFKIR